MKTKIGAILLIILAALGFSETMAAQHAEEEHTRRKTHGPPRSNANINHLERHHKSQNHHLDCFTSKGCF
jgi:ABC-type nickel/cobalt efflux system permease component RcnA